MATTISPSVRTLISGEGLTSLDSSLSFTLDEKIEISRLLKSTDGSVTIDFSYIDIVKTIYIEADGDFSVSFTAAANTINFGVSKAFRLDPTSTFRDTITSMAVSSTSEAGVHITVRVYGTTA